MTVPKGIGEMYGDLQALYTEYARANEACRLSDSERIRLLNAINKLTKQIDEHVENARKCAPSGTDWSRAK